MSAKDRTTRMPPPAARRGAWHGPASVVGVMVGLLVEAVPLLARAGGLSWLLFLLPPLVGALLLLAGAGTRRFGMGLLAAGVAYPIALVTYAATGLLG